MIDRLTIKIPFELAKALTRERHLVNKYQTNQLIKAVDTWLVLKAAAPGSYIQNWNKQKAELLRITKITETIFRHRINILSRLKLITISNKNLKLISWAGMAKIFDINIEKYKTILYDTSDKQRIQYWIIAAEILDNQSRQAYKIKKNMGKNPETKMALITAAIRYGADRNKLTDEDYFLAILKAMYLDDFLRVSEIHELLINLRPDINRGVNKMAADWKAKSPQTVSYWKGILKKSGIIDVSKIQIVSDTRTRNRHCKVLWLKRSKETLLILCDQIFVLEPWAIQNMIAA